MTTDMQELADLVGQTFPNADLIPVVTIPWGEDEAGLMVDHEAGAFRIGVYEDLTVDEEALAIIDVDTASGAWAVLEHLTENQPEGTDWSAWAAHWCESIWPDVQSDFA